MSYFKPQKTRKTGPRSICSLLDSTLYLSRKWGRVTLQKHALIICATKGVHPTSWVHLGSNNVRIPYKTALQKARRAREKQRDSTSRFDF